MNSNGGILRSLFGRIALFLLVIGLLITSAPDVFATGASLRRYSGSAYFDESRYSVYALAEETVPGTFAIRIALQYAPDYFTNDEIVAYQLRREDGTVIDVPAERQALLSAPHGFSTTVMITDSSSALQAVPVYYKFGPADREAFTITQTPDAWDAVFGTLAVVSNQNSATRLNLRYEPREDAKVWMQYYNGTPLVIQNVLPDGWVAVTIGGNTNDTTRGYMKAQYIAFGNDATQVQPAMPIQSADVVFTLYTEPDEASSVLTSGQKGTEMTVMGVSKTWWHVEAGGVQGYVKIDSVSLSGGLSQPTANRQPSDNAQPPQPTQAAQQAQSGAQLRTYSAKQTTGYGYVADAVVTEVSGGQFIVNVNIALPRDLLNDVVVAYNLYVNGVKTTVADRAQQDDAAPTRFKGTFSFSGTITSLRLIPVLEKNGENANDEEYIYFTVK